VKTIDSYRWPSLRAILLCCVVAAVAVGADLWFSAQEGYLARPPDYDGVGYLYYAQAPYHLIAGGHLKTALHDLNNVAPGWTAVLAAHYLVLGDGTWQAFAARFWPIALLLVLVYWIVRRRASRTLAIAAVGLTALLPLVSAGVRSSSWEFLSGQANYNDNWGLDDLRPDFLAVVLVLWAVALLAEHSDLPRWPSYLLSAAFLAASVLIKPSTGPVALVAWFAALAVAWFWNRRTPGVGRVTAGAVGLLAILLLPWAVFGHGISTTATYFYEAAVTFKGAYAMNLGLFDSATYYLVRIPSQLGQLESWPVIVGALLGAVALVRGRLGRAEWIYAGLVVLFYAAFTATSNKNPHVGEWLSIAVWIFFLAGVSLLLRTSSAPLSLTLPPERGEGISSSPRILALVAVYAVVVYALGAFALFSWPLNEQRANAQLVSVTSGVAGELNRHVSAGQCFSYAPGPGWPASLELLMINSDGASPQSTPIDVDPASTTAGYIATAARCPAIVVYREDVTQVAQVFFCPPVRQPYLRALASWVRSPGNGYVLDRSWQLSDLPPVGPHTLGNYKGVSLTVDLYLRAQS
jgi:hypothetical protein